MGAMRFFPLLVCDLLFPALSLVTVIISGIHQKRTGKHVSPVIVPFVGPVFLTAWILLSSRSRWLVPAAWLTDIGTIYALILAPRLLSEWWSTSSFTRIMTLEGKHEKQEAVLSLHSKGHYLLRKEWKRGRDEQGIVSLGEPGTYSGERDRYELVSFHGIKRILRRSSRGSFKVEEEPLEQPSMESYSLKDWTLELDSGAKQEE